MRLHSLTLQAFGPYVEQQFVDFDALARDGLYLFTGPTGAGKTTILDAVAYALYGQLPGVRKGTVHKIKSDHAGPTVRPIVTVECTLNGDRVRITRSPSYVRPAKRGGGTTTERSSVAVEIRTDGTWIGLEGGTRDNVVGDWIHRQVGLTCDQFMQVVLLPQGEFARFLLAPDAERESVLRTLFAADRFASVEHWFDDHERQLRTIASEAQAVVRSRIAAACAITGIDDAAIPDIADVAWFETLLRDAQVANRDARAATIDCTGRRATAQQRLTRGEQIAAIQTKRAAARRLAADAEQQIAKISHLRDRLVQGRKASVIAPLLHRRKVAQGAADSAASRLVAGRPDGAQKTFDSTTDLQESLGRRQAERASLRPAMTEEQTLGELRHAADEREIALKSAVAQLDLAIADRDALPAQLRIATEQLNTLRGTAADHDRLVTQLTAAREIVAAHQELQQCSATETSLRAAVLDATKTALSAKQYWLELRERRLAGIAAELAGELLTDSPCAVCGSSQHPEPAVGDGTTPTRAEDELAQHAAEATVLAQAKTERSLADSEIKTAALQAKCGAGDLRAASDRTDQIQADLDAAVKAIDDLERAAAMVRGLELHQSTLDDQVAQLRTTRDERSSLAAAELERLRGAEQRIVAAAGKYASVGERTAALDTQIRQESELLEATIADDDAQAELAAAEAGLHAAAIDADFASTHKAIEAHLPEADIEALQAQVDNHQQELIESHTMLADPDFVDLPDDVPQIELLREYLSEADRADRAAAGALSSTERAVQQLAVLHDQALPAIERAAVTQTEHTVVRDLALVVRGQGGNERGMHLSAYFLAARLEQVADVASGHLLKMTSGRYSLIHTDQRFKKRGAGGLGLEVMDAHTGVPRPTHTLSGGEGFLAALALALGLAEVVTAESGATTLDMLFIDEGFGALDTDALERAMSVLDDLRAGGRSVGLISHVEDLKTRITTQLMVTRTAHGSHIASSASTAATSSDAALAS